jgi:hypothetical protein
LVAIPTTAEVQGSVVEVKPAKSFGRSAVLSLQLTKLLMNGVSYSLETAPWSRSAKAQVQTTATEIGGGTAAGAAVGAAAGGGKGAGIGAGIGAAAGVLAATLTKGEPIVITPEAVISFTVKSPLTLNATTPAGNQPPASSGSGTR